MLLVKVTLEGGEDKVCWLETKSETFFVRSLTLAWRWGDHSRSQQGLCKMPGFFQR